MSNDPNQTRPDNQEPQGRHASSGDIEVRVIKHDGQSSVRKFKDQDAVEDFIRNSSIYVGWSYT